MSFGRSAILAVGTTILAAAAVQCHPAHATPPAHVAMVIGNGTYDAMPPLPACLLSAHAVSAALRNAGFDVVEREDVTSGGTDAAIGDTGRALAAAPGATAFIYVCAYATAFNDRAFLLPTSANLARPADVLTQGVLAKSLIGILTRGGARSAILIFDIVPAPGAPAALGLDAAMQGNLPDGLGSIAVSQATPPETPTPLAASLVANLKPTMVQATPLLGALQQQLAANKALTIAAIHVPDTQFYVVGGPAPAPSAQIPPPRLTAPPSVQTAPPGQAEASAQAVPPAPATVPSTPAAATGPSGATTTPAPPGAALPSEAEMTDADRRRVQTALARLGYYDGLVDGVFGPDTRAAIRRYQHELGAAMTGRLTAEQASKLGGGA